MNISEFPEPGKIKDLSIPELEALCAALREYIIENVAENGGHLASNLGVVEIVVALFACFEFPQDKLIFDVGHQSYAYKILTGRSLSKIRRFDGVSGFPVPSESEYDAFIAGHAGIAVSVANGMAVSAMLQGQSRQNLALIGDGSFSCGITFEAMNNINIAPVKTIVILNDNKMSISRNTGGFSAYLNRMISGNFYKSGKKVFKALVGKLPGHVNLSRRLKHAAGIIKSAFLPGVVFEELGFRYLGPINGHSLPDLLRVFKLAKEYDRPILLHVLTEKGHGYAPAVEAPEKFHGIGGFDRLSGQTGEESQSGFSFAFGKTMLELNETFQPCAITAAMKSSTGLGAFAKKAPERFFDVGIAEAHAVSFAAGLSQGGKSVVVALYATFLQRALDNVYHEIALQNLPVILAVDRAGIVEDGPTHHGIYDLSFLRSMPNFCIMAPKNENELRFMLHQAIRLKRPCAIRYPRGKSPVEFDVNAEIEPLEFGRAEVLKSGKDAVIFAMGCEVYTALAAAEILEKSRISLMVVNIRYVKPFDRELLLECAQKGLKIFTLENHTVSGGVSAEVSRILAQNSFSLIHAFGYPDYVPEHGSFNAIKEKYGLMPEQLAERIKAAVPQKKRRDFFENPDA